MEYTQWATNKKQRIMKTLEVLILVVMEYTQWVEYGKRKYISIWS